MLKKVTKKLVRKVSKQKFETLNCAYISRQNLIHNFSLIISINPKQKFVAVLKSNAYGHGIEQISEILNNVDCEFIAVDGYFEANKILGITKHKILVMGYILPSNIRLIDNKKCSFVVQDKELIKALGNSGKKFNIHLEINTGMNRLGISLEEIDDLLDEIKRYSNLYLEGVMSHLADADSSENTYTEGQVLLFYRAVDIIKGRGFSPKYLHIAQTAGSVKVESRFANTVRIGIGLYGINPLDIKDKNYSKLEGLRPVLELKSKIIKIHDLVAGEKISYNGIYKTDKPSRIAVLPLGYYEWIPRELSNKGYATFGYKVLPVRGRVCMNHTMVDVTGTDLSVGDEVVLISSDNKLPNSITNIAKKHGFSEYELLTRVSESIRRVVV